MNLHTNIIWRLKIMAKKIRFPLEMDGGIEVRDVESLKENFSLQRIMGYFENGKLLIWLRDRYANDLADAIENLDKDSTSLAKDICEIFDVVYQDELEEDLKSAVERNRRLALLKEYTSDVEYIDNIDYVAFDQDDVYDLLDEGADRIYLCGKRFSIPIAKNGVSYIGINDPEVFVDSKTEVNWREKEISLRGIHFDEKYNDIIQTDGICEAESLFLNNKMEEAHNAFLKLAEKNNGRAMYFLGEIYSEGFAGIEVDESKANDWRYRGFKQGDVLAGINYAYTLSDENEKKKLVLEFYPQLESLAKKNLFAKYELAWLYNANWFEQKDSDKYISLLKECADDGYWYAMNILANNYYNGSLVERDYTKAVEYYLSACEKEYGWAEHNLANCYFNGEGVDQDYSLAAKWYEKAATHGIGDSANKLGLMYYRGQGVDKNQLLENKWFKYGAKLGNSSAAYNYALNCRDGWGMNTDLEEAFNYFFIAAEKGHLDARNCVGIAYLNGDGVSQDYEKATANFKIAAEAGLADAQNRLGVRYANGQGVEQNVEKQFFWYTKAAAQNHEKAIGNLKIMCDLQSDESFLTARNGLVYFYKLSVENFLDHVYEVYEMNYSKNKRCLYRETVQSSFAPIITYVQNDDHLIISIQTIEKATILHVLKSDEEKVAGWSITPGANVYLELSGDILEIYEQIINSKTHIKSVTLKKATN